MLNIYILQNITKNNVIEIVALREKTIIDWAKRFLSHHQDTILSCTVWHWSEEVKRFNVDKQYINQ